MPTSASTSSRQDALKSRHAALTNKIELEQGRPGASDWYLKALKRQRLHLKEQIEGIS
jgi:hypothetical protein